MYFTHSVDHRVKIKESEEREKYYDLAKELKKKKEHSGKGDSNYNWYTWNGIKKTRRKPEGIGYQGKNRDYQTTALLGSVKIL